MKGKFSIRGLVALTLAAALFFHALPSPARGAELVSGRYLLRCGEVYLGTWDDGWITAVSEEYAEPWTLTATEDTVTLTDPNGITVCPGPEGLSPGRGSWQVTFEEGLFRFRSVYEGVPMILAANAYADFGFRAVPEAEVAAAPEIYPSGFMLYPVPEDAPEETTVPEETTAPEETAPPTTIPEETLPQPPELPWRVCFGRLHSHSAVSDGSVSAAELFARARDEGLDFYAVTDHSDSFDNDTQGDLGTDGGEISAAWAAGRAAAADVTTDSFLGLYGFEMSWPRSSQLGHIAVLGTPGWLSRNREDFAENPEALPRFYDALAAQPGSLGIFAHPGEDSGDFETFGHRTAPRDKNMNLVEIGGEEGFDLSSYLLALEQGWHVAPAVTRHRSDEPGTARTAVLAKDISEKALLEAVSNRRVYATTDADLTVYFETGGVPMGTVTKAGSDVTFSVTVFDPTDQGARVELLGKGGTVLAKAGVEGHGATLSLYQTRTPEFCFLRITQPDGDMAVTAPIWFVRATDMGIADFRTETQVPTRGKPVSLTLSLYNNEAVAFLAETAVFSIGDRVIHGVNLEPVPGGGKAEYSFTYTHPDIGITDIRAVVTGTVAGEKRTYEKILTLRFRMEDSVSHILVDGSHGGAGSYDRLASIAAEANATVTLAKEITWETLKTAELLIIPAGSRALEPEFLEMAAEFVKNGGNLILCGRSDKADGAVHWSAEGNRLLKMLGQTLRLGDDTALDDIENRGTPESLAAKTFNKEASFCDGLAQGQIYRQDDGCTVSGGTWLVRGFDTTRSEDRDGDGGTGDAVLLAMENSRFGGKILVAGGDFLEDDCMPERESLWSRPTINQGILETLLKIQRTPISPATIREARTSPAGAVVSVRGYVTAGTDNARTRFPELIYIQDETGGIAVTDFRAEGIEIGTAIELIGQKCTLAGNPALKLLEYRLTGEKAYRFDPKNSRHADAMDYDAHGGELLQVEGTVKSLTKTADGKGLTRLILKDAKGDLAEILIEPYILSGSTGKNDLSLEIQKGRTVRARGILHLDEAGKPVLRVRNCDEVVYVPPNIIPKTGDDIAFAMITMALSGGSLLRLRKKKTK